MVAEGLTCTVCGLLVTGTAMGEAPPVMVTAVALVKVTVNVEALPKTTDAGLAERVTVGVGTRGAVTVTVAVAVADAPVPVAVAVYVVVLVGVTDWVPPVAVRV